MPRRIRKFKKKHFHTVMLVPSSFVEAALWRPTWGATTVSKKCYYALRWLIMNKIQ